MDAKMTVDPKGMKKLLDKIAALGVVGKSLLHKEAKETAKSTRRAARRDFRSRYNDPRGLASNIRYRTVRRRKSDSAYEVTTNADREPIMAYIEFGTRDSKGTERLMDFSGIQRLFGSMGRRKAAMFRKDSGKFSSRKASPYFYHNAANEMERFKDRMIRHLIKASKK